MKRRSRLGRIMNRDCTDAMLWILVFALMGTIVCGGLLFDQNFQTRQALIQQRVDFHQTLGMERLTNNKKIEALRWDIIQYTNDLEDKVARVDDVLFAKIRETSEETSHLFTLGVEVDAAILNNVENLSARVGPKWAASYQQMQDATVWITSVERDPYGEGPAGWGSGVFIADNKIMTAHHVAIHVDLVAQDNVVVYQGKEYRITGVHLDPNSDLATIDTEEIPELFIPELLERDIILGDTVVIVGTPMDKDLHLRVSQGIVSHLDRGDDSDEFHGWGIAMGTDATAGPGNSGGPVFIEGKLAALLVGGWGGGVGPVCLILPVSEFD